MKKIILASGSPRRLKILNDMGVDCEVIKSQIEEISSTELNPQILAMSLAFEKAHSVASSYPGDLILGADTIVSIDGKILGKPKDKEEATEFIKRLSGKIHDVITGFCLISIDENIKLVDYEISHVKFKPLFDEEIESYVKTDEPYDKAGGYAIQGKGNDLVESFSGEYENIVGLPKEKLQVYLKRFGVI